MERLSVETKHGQSAFCTCAIFRLSNGTPPNGRVFFSGIRRLPPRAGIRATST
jgi:hypothetical protein